MELTYDINNKFKRVATRIEARHTSYEPKFKMADITYTNIYISKGMGHKKTNLVSICRF